MKRYFSPSTQGFYVDEIQYPTLPSDVVEITEDQHNFLVNAINEQAQEVYIDDEGKLSLRNRIIPTTWTDITRKRNRLLSKSDYTQMPDWNGDKAAWAVYRQALRDIPQTFETPNDVVWPTPPGE